MRNIFSKLSFTVIVFWLFSGCSLDIGLPRIPFELDGKWALSTDPDVEVLEFHSGIVTDINMRVSYRDGEVLDTPNQYIVRVVGREIQATLISALLNTPEEAAGMSPNPDRLRNDWRTFCYTYTLDDGILAFDTGLLGTVQRGSNPFENQQLVRVGYGRIPSYLWGEWVWEGELFTLTVGFPTEKLEDGTEISKTMTIKTEMNFASPGTTELPGLPNPGEIWYDAMHINKRITLYGHETNPNNNPDTPSRVWCDYYSLQNNGQEVIFLGGLAEELTGRTPFVRVVN